MAQILDDNSVIPSYLGIRDQGFDMDPGNMTNLALRPGEVREIIYPDDKRSVTGRFTEYMVEVQESDGNGPGTSTRYANCIVSNLFGSFADILTFTLRADKVGDQETGIGTGSKVLVLCVNGKTTQGVIIGGSRDTGTETQRVDKKDDGHNLKFAFNGIHVGINKDGELRVEYYGATDANGDLLSSADSNASGSSLVFSKDGSVKVFTAAGDQFIHLDHKNKKIDIHANKEWNVTSDDTIDLTATGQMTLTAKTCSIDMDDRAFIRTAGLYVGTASDATLLGETFRRNQGQMHTTMSSTLDSLGGLISTAATNLQVAATLLKIPVAGPALSSVPLQLAATALNGAGPMFNALSAAIKTFEAGNYLSTKNKSD